MQLCIITAFRRVFKIACAHRRFSCIRAPSHGTTLRRHTAVPHVAGNAFKWGPSHERAPQSADATAGSSHVRRCGASEVWRGTATEPFTQDRIAAERQGCHVHASSTHCQSSFGRGDQRALLTTLDGTAQWRQCTTVRCLCGASRRGDVPPRAAPQCGAAMWSRVKAPSYVQRAFFRNRGYAKNTHLMRSCATWVP